MTPPIDWRETRVEVDGVALQTYRAGDGPPVLLAHGFYESARRFDRLAADLVGEYAVVAYDARGHGRSAAPASGYDVESRVADLVGVVDALELDDPVLLGHSMGGSTVAATAARHTDLPRGVVLVDPAGMLADPPMGPDERAESVRARVAEWGEQSVEELRMEFEDERPETARRLAVARSRLRPEIAEIQRAGFPPVEERFADVACPTLVLKRDADPERRAAELDAAADLRNGRLVHVPGAGHAVLRNEYEASLAELLTFLRRV